MAFSKPRLVVSKCFFEHTRYDGGIISDKLVKKLSEYCEFVMVCPEVEIGLPIPREPIDVFFIDNEYRLMNKSQSIDLTEKMNVFSENFAEQISSLQIDGMILKSKSPSCGLNDAKLYGPNGRVMAKTAGLFAKSMVEKFPNLMVESEMRLTNTKIRLEFLTFIFVHSDFRNVKTKKELIDFHSRNKFLLLTKNEKLMRELGKLVAKKGFDDQLMENYRIILVKALKTPFKSSKVINTLLHMYGFFKDKLSEKEKAYFMDLIEDYKNGIVALQTLNALIKSWALRYNVDYILTQTFLEPYPKELEKIES
uniref:DUF1722 domain-containing protein n=1 Tax=Fervidobacterium nodosum TaxID=2424 RepID=A0A7C5U458_9BACT